MTLSEELQWRGFVNQTTYADLTDLDKTEKLIFYHGFDAASADSLTIGNLAALMLDKCFIRHGHKAILLAGGATSLIGDPGGKDVERPLQDEKIIMANVEAVKNQITKVLDQDITMVNNLSWFKDMPVLEFLRDVGKHFSMTPLVQRDYIATRMGEKGVGISYTEFSYTILQGYDFLYLHKNHAVNLQLSGSDQWGNCLSGVDLVRKVTGDEVHAFTMPLIIDKTTGKKFGKSESGAVWLDEAQTSVYQFYQFWLNVDDDDVDDYLKIFTELDKLAIDQITQEFNQNKPGRSAQKRLAYEVTKQVHGPDRANSVVQATTALFSGAMTEDDAQLLKAELTVVNSENFDSLPSTIVGAGLAESNSEANRFIESGGISVNGQKLTNSTDKPFKSGSNLLKRGKNSFAIVEQK